MNIVNSTPDTNFFVIGSPRHPSLSSFMSVLFPNDVVRHTIVPDHIHIFTEKSLSILLEKSGLVATHTWRFGQDFYELLSMLTQIANKEVDTWPKEVFGAINDVQKVLDKNGLSDAMIVIAQRK